MKNNELEKENAELKAKAQKEHKALEIIKEKEVNMQVFNQCGFLLAKTQKEIRATFTSKESVKYMMKDLFVELKQFKFASETEEDWDSSMTTIKKVTATEQAAILKKREEDRQKRKDDSEVLINQLTNVKGGKAPAPKKDNKKVDPKADKNAKAEVKPEQVEQEEADIDMEEINPEPQINTVMSVGSKPDEEIEEKGLVLGHAYTLLGGKSYETEDEFIDLIKVRNPWGEGEWNGDWSDKSKKWTEELKEYFEVVKKAQMKLS